MQSETEQGIFEQVLKGELDFISEPWPNISESAKDLVRRMLTRDPKKRITAHEVLREYRLLCNWILVEIKKIVVSMLNYFCGDVCLVNSQYIARWYCDKQSYMNNSKSVSKG